MRFQITTLWLLTLSITVMSFANADVTDAEEALASLEKENWDAVTDFLSNNSSNESIVNYIKGRLFLSPNYEKYSIVKGISFLETSAQQGVLKAKVDLLDLYMNSNNWEIRNINRAEYWARALLRNSVNTSGGVSDNYVPTVAWLYISGMVLEKDIFKALLLCSRLLEQHENSLCRQLTTLYSLEEVQTSTEELAEIYSSIRDDILSI